VVLKGRYPAPLRLNPEACGVLAIVDVQSAARVVDHVAYWVQSQGRTAPYRLERQAKLTRHAARRFPDEYTDLT
jgi:hypothetical protein